MNNSKFDNYDKFHHYQAPKYHYGPKPIENCSCATSMRNVLGVIKTLVSQTKIPGFTVDLQITLNSGLSYTISIVNSFCNKVIITNDTLVYYNLVISLCEIVKIQVLTSKITNPTFANKLMDVLRNLTTKCELAVSRDDDIKCNYPHPNCCPQSVQNYLNNNKTQINSVAYNGSSTEIQTISLTNTSVVKNVSSSFSTLPFVDSVTITTSTATVVNSITTLPTNVVTNVSTTDSTLVSDVTITTTLASSPITVTPVTVVQSIVTIPQTLVSNVQVTRDFVVQNLTLTTTPAVADFPSPNTSTGVIGGMTAATIVNTTPVTVPQITAAVGGLFVFINGVTIPVIDSTGSRVTISAGLSVQALTIASAVLNATGTPTIVNSITSLGTPRLVNALTNVVGNTTLVATTITASTISATLITSSTSTSLNNITTIPTTVTVVDSLATTPVSIISINTVSSATINDISNISLSHVISAVTLSNTFNIAINAFTLTNSFVTIGSGSYSGTVKVLTAASQPITGSVDTVGAGIMVVKELNGDITIYSICEIDSASTV